MRVKAKTGGIYDAMQFKTNNEVGSPQMDAVCIWANQGRGANAKYHCWHDGTNVFVDYKDTTVGFDTFSRSRADVGDWILKTRDGYNIYDPTTFVVTEAGFAELERIPEAAE